MARRRHGRAHSGTHAVQRAPSMAALTVAALVAVPFSIAFLDRAVSSYTHDALHRPALFVLFTHIADWPVPIATLALALAALACLAGWRPGQAAGTWLAAAVAILVARALADELKYLFGRPWPETWIDHNPSWIDTRTYGFFWLHGGRGYASFPSGHETDIAAPAAALWRAGGVVPRVIAVAMAGLVGIGLVVSDYHFLGDVLAGLYLGIVTAYATLALFDR